MGILDQFRLDGKTALVTGCRRGIGRAYAQALAEAGADIIGASVSQEESGSDIEKDVTALGRKFKGYACDFSNREALYAFIKQVKDDGYQIDILVNNAGAVLRGPVVDHPDESWDTVRSINLDAPFILAREFGRDMVERGHGKIVFTASLMSFQGGILVPGYAASKGGIGQLMKAIANEWAPHGVNVNAIAPGYITTDVTQALWSDPERSVQIRDRIPHGRWGKPDDLKGAILYLCSDAANYVNGAILPVDGGWLAR